MNLKQRLKIRFAELYVHTMSIFEKARHGVSLNILSKDLWEDPYPHHNRMREKNPIHYSMAMRAYWVTPFEWVQEILLDKRFGADVRSYPERYERIVKDLSEEQLENFNNPSMLNLDPPDHSRIRRLASQGFMRNFIQSLEPRIRDIVRDCLAAHDNAASMDVVDVLAKPVPAVVIAEMLGLPEKDHDDFQKWSQMLVDSTSTNDPGLLEKGQRANTELLKYFKKVVADKRHNPGDDMTTMLIAAEEEGDKLTELELLNTCLLLLVAGHETTTRLISNGLYLLLTHPAQFAWLKDNPAHIPAAVEEMLRFEPPVQATRRFVREDLTFHGTQLKRGDLVFVSIAASNRDPAVNDNPDTFNIRRETVKQVGFGYGIHLCIGASLARMEAKVAFEELLARYPNMTLQDEKPTWGNNAIFRGLETLNIQTN